MVKVEPYDFQKKTNIKEHNDMVGKINEIVNVINETSMDVIVPRVDALETEVNAIKSTDNLQWTDIENLKTNATAQATKINVINTDITGIKESLVSDVAILSGVTTGKIKIRIDREKAPSIDSDDYELQKAVSVELVQGSSPSMVKSKVTLSDGTVLESNDFLFTSDPIGSDVYISSFIFKNGDVNGTISADIGLSNGNTLEANNFAVPTDPSIITSIEDLKSRVTAVEGSTLELTELKSVVAGHTASIQALDTDVADIQLNKADADNSTQTIVSGTIRCDSTIQVVGSVDGVEKSTRYGIVGGTAEGNPFNITMLKEVDGSQVDTPIGQVAIVDATGIPLNFNAGGGYEFSSQPIMTYVTNHDAEHYFEVERNLRVDYYYSTGASIHVMTGFISKGRYTFGQSSSIYLGHVYWLAELEPCYVYHNGSELKVWVSGVNGTQITDDLEVQYATGNQTIRKYKLYVQ